MPKSSLGVQKWPGVLIKRTQALITGDIPVTNRLHNPAPFLIPLFVLMGLLVSRSELGRDIYEVANVCLRRVKGGLGVAAVVANAAFAAITGVSIASASVFTRVSVPEMIRFGYQPRFAVGIVAGSSVLGMLIPPSVMLIIYAIITEQSVAAMFKAGIFPGIVLALAYIIAIVAMAIFAPDWVGGQDRKSRELSHARSGMSVLEMTRKASPLVILVLLVLGGIYGGVFTPTEAGAVGALGALIIALIKRRLDRSILWKRPGMSLCGVRTSMKMSISKTLARPALAVVRIRQVFAIRDLMA